MRDRRRYLPLAVAIFGPDAPAADVDRVQATYRTRYLDQPDVSVTRHARIVRAGGAAAPVVVVVARRDRLHAAKLGHPSRERSAMFALDNTEGYSPAELDVLNAALEEVCRLSPGIDEKDVSGAILTAYDDGATYVDVLVAAAYDRLHGSPGGFNA